VIKALKLKRTTVTPGSPGSLRGGVVGQRSRVVGLLRNQDRVCQAGARVVLRWGAGDAPSHGFSDSASPAGTGSQLYPLPSSRVAARARVELTPGYQLRVRALLGRTGPSQAYDPALFTWNESTVGGYVEVTAALEGPSTPTEVVTATLTPPVSQLANKAIGDTWATVIELTAPLQPAGLLDTPAGLLAWSSPPNNRITASIAVQLYGGVRVWDLVVYEEPIAAAWDTSTLAAAAHFFADGNGQPLDALQRAQPVDEVSSADPTQGAALALEVAAAQVRELVPALWSWHARGPATGIAVLDPALVAVGPSLAEGFDGLGYGVALAGVSTASASLARTLELAGEDHELRALDGVIAVRVHVYGYTTGASGTVRVQSSLASWVDVVITSGSAGWTTATGELRVGASAEDDTTLRAMIADDGVGALYVYAITVTGERGR